MGRDALNLLRWSCFFCPRVLLPSHANSLPSVIPRSLAASRALTSAANGTGFEAIVIVIVIVVIVAVVVIIISLCWRLACLVSPGKRGNLVSHHGKRTTL